LLSALASTALATPRSVIVRASVSSTGTEGNSDSYISGPGSTLSANGRFVAFESNASNLVAGDNNKDWDVFLRDLKTGVTQRVSLDSAGREYNSYSSAAALSANGRFVVFNTAASNLVAEDNNDSTDVFVRLLSRGPCRNR